MRGHAADFSVEGLWPAPCVAVLQFRSGSPSAFAAILPQLRLADVASRIEPDSPDHDKRTFECPKCENVVSEIVKYRRD